MLGENNELKNRYMERSSSEEVVSPDKLSDKFQAGFGDNAKRFGEIVRRFIEQANLSIYGSFIAVFLSASASISIIIRTFEANKAQTPDRSHNE